MKCRSIKGSVPGHHREAKESLRRGKLPQLAGIHISWADQDVTFVLVAETLAISGMKLPTVLDKKKGPPSHGAAGDDEAALDAEAEAFYERMRLARDVEVVYGQVLEAQASRRRR